jgi:chemotaxis protein CheD
MLEVTADKKRVDMGDLVVTNQPSKLVTTVGSCIAACVYDYKTNLGGMAHVVLPKNRKQSDFKAIGKFADIAIPALISKMEARGANRRHLSAKIAGGANMFPNIERAVLNIGEENTRAVIEALRNERVYNIYKDVGGTKGRKVEFDVVSGTLRIERLDGETIEL